jgi:hypothetical protein
VRAVYKYLDDKVLPKIRDLPVWIRPVFDAAFPFTRQFTDKTNVFLACVEHGPTTILDILKTYEGIYSVFRYAAHISEAPTSPCVPRDKVNARVIRAAMRIYESGSTEWPAFSIRYQPTKGDHIEAAVSIEGIIIPIMETLYFLGIEGEHNNPMIIATKRTRGRLNQFCGLVLRRHQIGRILASKVMFVKSSVEPTQAGFSVECEKIGSFREADLSSELESIKDSMYNDVVQYGKGVLLL